MLFVVCCFFFKINIFEKFFQEYYLSVKQIGPRSGPDILSGLNWVQSVCKVYEQTTLVGKELNGQSFNIGFTSVKI